MKITRSASCSTFPDSRRSVSWGILGLRDSTARLSCDRAITGTSSSRARSFSPRLSSPTAVIQCRVLGDVGDQGALAHGGPGGDDDQVARLKAAGHLVEVLEARRGPGQDGVLERQAVQLVDLVVKDVLNRAKVLLAIVTGDLEHRLLGLL